VSPKSVRQDFLSKVKAKNQYITEKLGNYEDNHTINHTAS